MHACRWVLIVIARLFYVRMILPSSFLIHVQILNQRNLARNLESCLNWLFDTKLALHDGENSVRYLVLKENQVKLMIFPFSVKSMFLNLLNKYIFDLYIDVKCVVRILYLPLFNLRGKLYIGIFV